jgi:hypothetical protein
VVGVEQPTSVFSNLSSNRTMAEMLALANEMAQRIAYDTRDWTVLVKLGKFSGDGVSDSFTLPADYRRMLLNSNVWRSNNTQTPMRFIPDADEWLWRRNAKYADSQGEWTLRGNKMFIIPVLAGTTLNPADYPGWQNSHLYNVIGEIVRDDSNSSLWKVQFTHTSAVAPTTFQQDRNANPTYWTQVLPTTLEEAQFNYLQRNCVQLASSGDSDSFIADGDTFVPDERLLKLAMIWQWKANKGSPYAEDMANYATALDVTAGSDKPAPIIIGRTSISANARLAYPWPSNWGPQ